MVVLARISHFGATRASAVAFLMPPVALFAGVVLNGEHVAPLAMLGSAVCLLGAWFLQPRRGGIPRKPATLREEGMADPEGILELSDHGFGLWNTARRSSETQVETIMTNFLNLFRS
jgi:hypothetical protein